MNRIEFYQMIGTGIRRYLPMGYQEYQVMSLEPYLDRVEAGMDEDVALVDIAVDYAKMVSIQHRSQHHQMVR